MTSTLITGSQVDRLLRCSAGAILLKASDPALQAEAGTATHAEVLRPDGLPEVFATWLREGCPNPPEEPSVRFEAAFSWSPGSGRAAFLGCYLERAYPEPEEPTIATTLDAVARAGKSWRFRVADLKTGAAQLYRGALPEPGDSWQLRTQATLTWIAFGRPEFAEFRLAWFLHDAEAPRSWVREAPAPFGAAALREWEETLSSLLRRIDRGEVRDEFRRGPWCLSCSSFDFCPAQRDVLRRIAELEPAGLRALSDAELDDLWLDLRCFERMTERARAALTAHVERRARVPSRDGRKELVPGRVLTRKVRDVARLKEEAARRGVFGVTRETATAETIRAAFVAARVGDDGGADEFLSEMEAAGIIEKVSSQAFLTERPVPKR